MRGSLRQRSPGSWQLRWDEEDPTTGKRVWRSTTFHGKKSDAEAKLAELMHAKNTGGYIEPNKITVREFLTDWLRDDVAVNIQKTRTREYYAGMVARHIVPSLGAVILAKLAPSAIEALYREKLDAGLSSTTVAGIHRTLHRALERAVRQRLIGRNPCDAVSVPKKRHIEYTTWTPSESARFLATAKTAKNRYHPLFATLIHTGLRIGEALGLRWADVDLDTGVLTVRQTLEEAGTAPRFGTPKTERSRRSVPLDPMLVGVLRTWKATQNEERLLLGADYRDYGLVFTIPGGGPVARHNLIRRDFATLTTQANVPRIRLHDLRHSAASTLLGAGTPLKTVSEMLGHSSITVTADVYGHLAFDAKRTAATTLARILADADAAAATS